MGGFYSTVGIDVDPSNDREAGERTMEREVGENYHWPGESGGGVDEKQWKRDASAVHRCAPATCPQHSRTEKNRPRNKFGRYDGTKRTSSKTARQPRLPSDRGPPFSPSTRLRSFVLDGSLQLLCRLLSQADALLDNASLGCCSASSLGCRLTRSLGCCLTSSLGRCSTSSLSSFASKLGAFVGIKHSDLLVDLVHLLIVPRG